MIYPTVLLCALSLFSNVVHASFDVRSACKIDTYGPFGLYFMSDTPSGTSLINVVKLGVDDNNNTISTLTVSTANLFLVSSPYTSVLDL